MTSTGIRVWAILVVLARRPRPLLLRLQPVWNSPGNSTDNNGNLRSVTEDNGTPGSTSLLSFTQTFTYDQVNRLSTASDTGGWSRSFGYDQYGNSCVGNPGGIGAPTAPACTQNGAGQWIVLPPTVYNNQNQLTVDASSYDTAGNLKAINGDALTYDAENRQVSFTPPNGMGIGPETYAYDGNGNRVQKSGSGLTTTYIYDAFNQLKAEYSSAEAGASPCTPCYLSDDHLGSLRLMTKSDGTVLARHDYLPFGEEIQNGQGGRSGLFGATDNVSQRFTGKERDQETGLDFFGARYFGAALGRFTSPDPISGTVLHILNPTLVLAQMFNPRLDHELL
jgi:RHS repeat-associated protein